MRAEGAEVFCLRLDGDVRPYLSPRRAAVGRVPEDAATTRIQQGRLCDRPGFVAVERDQSRVEPDRPPQPPPTRAVIVAAKKKRRAGADRGRTENPDHLPLGPGDAAVPEVAVDGSPGPVSAFVGTQVEPRWAANHDDPGPKRQFAVCFDARWDTQLPPTSAAVLGREDRNAPVRTVLSLPRG